MAGNIQWDDVSLITSLKEISKPRFQINHRWRTRHTTVLTSIRDEGVYWTTTIYSSIRRGPELNNKSRITSGWRDHQVALPPYALDHLVESSRYGPLSKRSTPVSATGQNQDNRKITSTHERSKKWGKTQEAGSVANGTFFFAHC